MLKSREISGEKSRDKSPYIYIEELNELVRTWTVGGELGIVFQYYTRWRLSAIGG